MRYDGTESTQIAEDVIAKNRAISALNAVIVALSSSDSISDALMTALEKILSALGLSKGAIILHDSETDVQVSTYVGIDGPELQTKYRDEIRNFAERCSHLGEAIAILRIAENTHLDADVRRLLQRNGIDACVTVPLIRGESVIAILAVALPAPVELTLGQIEFFSLAGSILGPVIDNARLRSGLADRVDRMAMLDRLAKLVNSGTNVRTIVGICLREIAAFVDYDVALVVVLDRADEAVVYSLEKGLPTISAERVKLTQGQSRGIIEMRRPRRLLSGDDLASISGKTTVFTASNSGAGAPLIYDSLGQGLLKIWCDGCERYGRRELQILEAVAEHLAVAVRNARLFEAERAKSRELEALAKEAQHRIKNNLQMICGLLNIAEQEPNGESRIIQRCLRQVRAISTVHEMLSPANMSDQLGLRKCLASIADNVLLASGRGLNIEISVSGQEIVLGADTVTAVGLIVNELVSNAVEHGFSDFDHGSIDIRISSQDNVTIVDVENNGLELPANFAAPSASDSASGLGLAASLALYGLGGRLEVMSSDVGVLASVTFPT